MHRQLIRLRSPFRRRVLYGHFRLLQGSAVRQVINPMLPFDVLEDLDNDDLEEANNKLKKEKKQLIKQRKKIEKILGEGEEEDGSSSKKKKASEESRKKEKRNEEQLDDTQENKGERLTKNIATAVRSDDVLDKLEKNKEESDGCKPESSGLAGTLTTKSSGSNTPTNLQHGESAAESHTSMAGGGGSGGGNSNNDDNDTKPASKNSIKEDKQIAKEKDKQKQIEEEADKEVEEEDFESSEKEKSEEEKGSFKKSLDKLTKFIIKCLETMGITFSSIAILGVAGILYHKFYAIHVLDKIDTAFDIGDPAFQLAVHKRTDKYSEGDDDKCDLSQYWAQRPQQELLDDIIAGKIVGRYFLVIGEKGTGKTSLLLESMKKVNGYNVAMFDAHADPEIFRLRLGKALNFAYSEDYIGSLFSIRGPRDTTALLDIERAFSKLEELAMKRIIKNKGRPLVLIINNSHLIKENEDGSKLVELLQQKAESLSGSGLATIIFNSDDYWVYEKLKKLGTRLEVINVRDFSRKEAIKALHFTREKFFPSFKYPDLKIDDKVCNQVYDLIGGRPQHISQVARHKDIFKACNEIIDREKTWFLNQCGLLGEEMDDDVMESGKFSTSAMLLMRAFVEMDRQRFNGLFEDSKKKDTIESSSSDNSTDLPDHNLPELPLWRARQIMTRNDYIQQYDNLNIFTIDSDSRVRADSVPMMRAFHEIASQPQFDELLQETIQRVADIESLGRTRELVAKDLVLGGKYQIKSHNDKHIIDLKSARDSGGENLAQGKDKDEDNDVEDLLLEDISKKKNRKWWGKRMLRFDQSYSPPSSDNSEFSNPSDLSRTN